MGVMDHHFGLLQDLCLKSHKDHISVITPVMFPLIFEHYNIEEQPSNQKLAVGSTATSRFSQTHAILRLTPPNKSALWKNVIALSIRQRLRQRGTTVIRPRSDRTPG